MISGTLQNTRLARPHPVCCMCRSTQVSFMGLVCERCKDAFVLVDEQTPEMGVPRDQRIQIGPTDV